MMIERISLRVPLLLGLLAMMVPGTNGIWPFPSKRFTANAFVDAQSLGLDDSGRIVAFGDFDGDQFLDVVTLAPSSSPFNEQNILHIYTWSHDEFQFLKNSTLQSPNGARIVNVIPGDFTHSGRLDLLVMTDQGTKLQGFLFEGKGAGGFEPSPVSIPPSTLSQPIPLDYNGNMRIDMIGNTPPTQSTPSASDNALTIWKNVWDITDGQILFDTIPFGSSSSTSSSNTTTLSTPKCALPNPHSSAILDFNGDCLADLFLTCQDPSSPGKLTYQIWLNDPSGGGDNGGYTLARQGPLPMGTGMITFADMNRDGSMDMVFPTCDSVDSNGVGHGCSINIAYNKQMGFCSGATGENGNNCRRPESLCRADPNFTFDLTPGGSSLTTIPLLNLLRYSSLAPDMQTDSLLMYDTTHSPPLPLPIKTGDADLDGFADLLFIVVTPDDERVPKLVWNIPCSLGEPGCPALQRATKSRFALFGDKVRRAVQPLKRGVDKVKRTLGIRDQAALADPIPERGFVSASAGGDASVLASFRDARSVSFLDLDEDGTLDVLVQRTGTGTGGSKEGSGMKVNFVQNNVFHDAFFMKAIVLNGACGGMCTPHGQPAYHPFGVSYPGATYKYTILDTSGKRSAAQVAQLPQTAYHSLLTPYSFFGLGRTNNYVEYLSVGSTRKRQPTGNSKRSGEEEIFDRAAVNVTAPTPPNSPPTGEGLYYINLEGVIPNSKVVIIPPDTPGSNTDNDGEWKRELYLRPGDWIPWVSVTVVVTTILLGATVWAFWWNERREDEKERRKALHSINFDAL